jgi:hypothetical protein
MATKAPTAPAFKPNAAQASVLRNLSSLGLTSDYRAITKDGGNGLTLTRLETLGYVKIKQPTTKVKEKFFDLTATGKKLVAKLA